MQFAHAALLGDLSQVIRVSTRRLSNMCANVSLCGAGARGSATRGDGIGGGAFAGLVLLTLLRAADVSAGEQLRMPVAASSPDFGASCTASLALPWLPLPASYAPVAPPESPVYSIHDFRPRGHSIFDTDYTPNTNERPGESAPPPNRGTVWQRLSEFRAHNRIRLLTLWETGGGSVSLQAGRRGGPSLQWTSRLMNHGGATRGLLDQVFSTSIAGAGRELHLTPRGNVTELPQKSSKLVDGGAISK